VLLLVLIRRAASRTERTGLRCCFHCKARRERRAALGPRTSATAMRLSA
jgi:hypothetical protein